MSAADEAHLDSEDHRMQHVPLGVTVDAYTRVNCQRYPYPSAELAHLATVSFNQAMDLYKDAKDKDCQRWAKKAIRLAESMNDDEGKRLAALFRGRLNGLFRGSR